MLVSLRLNLLLQMMMMRMRMLQSFQELHNLVKMTMRMTLNWIFLPSVEFVECISRVCSNKWNSYFTARFDQSCPNHFR